jgi:hypothetical protein
MARSIFFFFFFFFFLFTALVLGAILSILTTATSAYAQDGGMMQTTSKGTLDIRLAPTWNEGGQATFAVSFLNPGTETLHEHQDYDFRILRDGQQVFSAANQVGQPLLHNVEGTLTVPFTFQENGDYTIQVYLAGTGIPAIPTDEEATFPITVVPEFPAGIMTAALAVLITVSGAIFAQRFKLV